MISITHHLARRLETAEAEDGVRCVKAQSLLDPEAGATFQQLLGGYLLFVSVRSPLSHALALGFDCAVTENDVEQMEAFYRDRGMGVTIDVCPYADSSLVEALTKGKYRITDFATVLVRRISAEEQIPEAVGGPAIRAMTPGEEDLYAEVVVRGFFGRDDVTSEEQNLGRVLAAMPDTLSYFAELDGVAAGCGQMAIHNGVASCFGDSTMIPFRRRGAHSALIRARLADAAALGCDLVTAGTQPGSTSQRDYEQLGFQVAYTKVTMVLD